MKAEHLQTLALNLRSIAADLYAGASRPTDAETIALASIVIDEQARTIAMREGAADIAAAAPPPKPERKRAPKGQGSHRHKFDVDGKCDCGAARRRAARGSGERPSPEARTVPLPMSAPPPARRSLGEYDDDPFADGNMGSSGVRR